ncbi:hypothetical protein A6X21_01265 [Planctopirus hydrillae]|uniref:Uncharacterized protein n=1 Tax=Planctopirus hydrillae TaxID=1841610 RepID=A0A1C3E4U5_9PLAN|nr:hypothetical protein A6X21_01265 [Planctopirus hydrillae]
MRFAEDTNCEGWCSVSVNKIFVNRACVTCVTSQELISIIFDLIPLCMTIHKTRAAATYQRAGSNHKFVILATAFIILMTSVAGIALMELPLRLKANL